MDSTLRTQHSGSLVVSSPLQLFPLYELFVREHPLHSLGLRLDWSVCNPPVLVKKPKDPVLTIPWEKE